MISFLTEFNQTEDISVNIIHYKDDIYFIKATEKNKHKILAFYEQYLEEKDFLDITGEYPKTNNYLKEYYFKYNQSISIEDILIYPETLFIDDLIIYFHTTNEYLYNRKRIKYSELRSYITSPVNSLKSETRLELPNFNIKLSDNINGIVLNQDFSINLFNNDGIFDNEYEWNLYNTPLQLKKSMAENPEYKDYTLIRDGLIGNINIKFDTINITISDKIKTMDNNINNVIKQDNFNIIVDDTSLDKNIPIVYGKNKVKLIQLNEENYYISDYISTLHGVYDNDNNPVNYTFNNKIITSIDKADYAIITGYTNNRIGEIIKDLIINYTGFDYNSTNWDINEFEIYLTESDRVNIIFSNHTVKKAIQDVLKSDMAYFIQKLDGRFTVRKYRDYYRTHIIPNWALTKTPEKNMNKAIENYFSSCIVNFNIQDEEFESYLNDSREYDLKDFYNKELRRVFNTNLDNVNSARYLSNLLYDRYGNLKHTLKLNVGIDTSKMELLDFVSLDLNINDRSFSELRYYIIKEINPAQDSLVLEEIDYLDITGEYPDTDTNYYEADYDNLYYNSQDYEFEYIIEGGKL